MTAAVEVNIPLSRFATAIRSHDMTYFVSDDPRVYWNGAAQRDELIAMAKRLVQDGEPLNHILAVVELQARKRFSTVAESNFYVDQFRTAVER